jgi:hypothetical protein
MEEAASSHLSDELVFFRPNGHAYEARCPYVRIFEHFQNCFLSILHNGCKYCYEPKRLLLKYHAILANVGILDNTK